MSNDQKETEQNKRKLKLLKKYDNDDYSRYASNDYVEKNFEIGEELNSSNVIYPEQHIWNSGISGGDLSRPDFYGIGPKNYQRTDEKIFEDISEILMRHRDIDASEIVIKVNKGEVLLSGMVASRQMKKMSEAILLNISGVKKIINELVVTSKNKPDGGPSKMTKKDLGIT